MDEKTRGYIESRLDRFANLEMVTAIKWVQGELPISSLRDLAIGYFIGGAEAIAYILATMGTRRTKDDVSDEDSDAIITMIKRRLPEIVEKVNRELNV